MCNCTYQNEELALRRQIEYLEEQLQDAIDMNNGGRCGHSRGFFTDQVTTARARLFAARQALETIRRNR